MKNLRFLLPLTFLAVAFVIPIQPTHAYENSEYAFAIDAPEGWIEKHDDKFAPAALISFINPESVSSILQNISEISVFTFTTEKSFSVNDLMGKFADKLQVRWEKNDSAMSIESENIVKIGNLDCYQVVFTIFGGDHLTKYKEAIFIQNGVDYDLLFFATNLETFDKNLPIFDQCLQTFRLTGTPSVTPIPGKSIDNLLMLPAGSFTTIVFVLAIVVIVASVAIALRRRHLKRNPPVPSQPALA